MAAERVWRATCELCQFVEEFDGALTVEALGHALREANWHLPIYGGTFHRTCYNRMRAVMGEPPLPDPDPLADLLATVTKVRNTLFHALGIDTAGPRALPERIEP
ncbi:hypothetical protein SEA_FLAGSTAFF_50 [Mycobacterium phage FlagStaff]|uniref:Uncharacterized protein n=1 Tax=Mycobacterium phage FlagStaff TaxID=1647304 RepID=A0A0F6SJM7_9CAUD|nr:hypothetical protein AVT49_gp50 [Mycobacterium phage FlagStaff]AKF14487.1 hypothetical protein SEA_FLAGSTAFF_50 [Mycobacterium phage FlagStaff]